MIYEGLLRALVDYDSARRAPAQLGGSLEAGLVYDDGLGLLGRLDGVGLLVNPVEFFQRTALRLNAEEVPTEGFDAVPDNENIDEFVA